jgi:hypothetical protein
MNKKQRREQERQAKLAKEQAEKQAEAITATATVQPEIDKNQSGVTVVISSTVLGQKRAEYARHKEAGLTEERILERMTEDAALFGVSIEQYKGMLSNLKSRSVKGENLDEARAKHTDKLAQSALAGVGFLNGVLSCEVDKLNAVTVKRFLKDGQATLAKLVEDLQNTEITTKRGKQAWMFPLHAPVYNFITDTPTGTKLFALFVGGWSDKSRSYDQYGIRQEASGSATFYRPVSYETPVTTPVTAPAPVTTAPE